MVNSSSLPQVSNQRNTVNHKEQAKKDHNGRIIQRPTYSEGNASMLEILEESEILEKSQFDLDISQELPINEPRASVAPKTITQINQNPTIKTNMSQREATVNKQVQQALDILKQIAIQQTEQFKNTISSGQNNMLDHADLSGEVRFMGDFDHLYKQNQNDIPAPEDQNIVNQEYDRYNKKKQLDEQNRLFKFEEQSTTDSENENENTQRYQESQTSYQQQFHDVGNNNSYHHNTSAKELEGYGNITQINNEALRIGMRMANRKLAEMGYGPKQNRLNEAKNVLSSLINTANYKSAGKTAGTVVGLGVAGSIAGCFIAAFAKAHSDPSVPLQDALEKAFEHMDQAMVLIVAIAIIAAMLAYLSSALDKAAKSIESSKDQKQMHTDKKEIDEAFEEISSNPATVSREKCQNAIKRIETALINGSKEKITEDGRTTTVLSPEEKQVYQQALTIAKETLFKQQELDEQQYQQSQQEFNQQQSGGQQNVNNYQQQSQQYQQELDQQQSDGQQKVNNIQKHNIRPKMVNATKLQSNVQKQGNKQGNKQGKGQ